MVRSTTILLLSAVALVAGVHASALAGLTMRLELAPDGAALSRVIQQSGLSLEQIRRAFAWDYAYLLAYGPLTAIAAAFAGLFLGGRWETVGGVASFAVLTGAVFDALENTAVLQALEGHHGLAFALGATAVKLLLTLPAAAFALVACIGSLFSWKRARSPAALPVPGKAARGAPSLTCDVVMKGGITSGVVYPRAVAQLAQEYRFVNVGGASAGAIAASTTAAAEYARANGRDGFSVIDALPAWLGGDGRLFSLFRPQPSTRAPFEVFAAFLGNLAFPFKLARAFAAAVWYLPVAFAVGLLPGLIVGWGAFQTETPAYGVSGAVGTSLVLVPVAMLVGLIVTVFVQLPRNGFGMCSGRLPGKEILSDWLSATLDNIAGIESPAPLPPGGQRRPLLFADLWTAGETFDSVEAMCAAAKDRPPERRTINFEALTTCLSHGRPYRMPQLLHTFYFQRADLVQVLPEYVVDWMVDHPGHPGRKIPEGFIALPAPHELPVVFAARLSLSFPFLISAVKLWDVDYDRPHNASPQVDVYQMDACWMSDGGISSNFPIHFFDAFIPTRPTFGLDLQPFHVDRKRDRANEANNVFLPDNNMAGFRESWKHFDNLGGFVGALVDALQAFLDNLQARAPGFRDRIARIYLEPDEGGLNLAMPPAVLDRLSKRGQAAGQRIIDRFIVERPSGWDNHRWVRLRLLLGRLDPLLRQFARNAAATTPLASPPSYELTKAQLAAATSTVTGLRGLGEALEQDDTNLADGAPRPVPELRITPRV